MHKLGVSSIPINVVNEELLRTYMHVSYRVKAATTNQLPVLLAVYAV
jgi:hypothetical protein